MSYHDPFDPMFRQSGDPITDFLAANSRNNLEEKVTLAPRELFNIGIIYEAGRRQAMLEGSARDNRELRDKLEERTKERDNAQYNARERAEWRDRALTAERKLDRIAAVKRKQKKAKGKK